MNIYALFPLIAILSYIPLLVMTISARPWRPQQKYFLWFLIAAIIWSLSDFFCRTGYFRDYSKFLGGLTIIMYMWMGVQFYIFNSSFYPQGKSRWIPFAYGTLAVVVVVTALGYLPERMALSGDKLYPDYGIAVLFVAVPLLTLIIRAAYLLRKRLKILTDPVLYNQIASLLLGLAIMTAFGITAFMPWAREYPVSHLGNISVAFILSYAAIGHRLLDIRLVLRRSLTWLAFGLISTVCYWLMLVILHSALGFNMDRTATAVVTGLAVLVAVAVYKLRSSFFITVTKALEGPGYNYRQRLHEFADKIHQVFSFREQGGELLSLVIKAFGCNRACLLFLEDDESFAVQMFEPEEMNNPISHLKIGANNPIINYLEKERKPLTRENLDIFVEFRSLWASEKNEFKSSGVELFIPLISRGKLIGILALGKKKEGKYSLEDFALLEDVADRVAVSMEKEYLRQKLEKRGEELSVINRSSAIITSSLDIQRIYDSFILELNKVVDVSWAAITLIEENEVRLFAISSKIGSAWQVGERLPIKGSSSEWVATHKKPIIESDLSAESLFPMDKYHLQQGIHSVVYMPLIAKEEVIGSLIVASSQPNAYTSKHINLLEQLAFQIAMPIQNARRYAEAEKLARIDGLSSLLNRRSLDEMLQSEIGRHFRYGGVFTIIVMDIDSFKAFNDNYGHLAGDRILRQLGNILKSSIRSADQAFRYGGDEFAVLLPQTRVEDAKKVAERIREQISSQVNVGNAPVTISLGIASWPANGLGGNEIIAAADTALYHAKRSGGNLSFSVSEASLLLFETVTEAAGTNNSETLSTIYSLAATVDSRDHYTGNHSRNVSKYAVALAEAINMSPIEVERLGTCALLHDIGKSGINDDILNKPGKLNEAERETMRTHSYLGAAIVSRVPSLAYCVPAILYHHERYDGTGYPKGLKDEQIPLVARILAITDAFAAMTSQRAYSTTLSVDDALEELNREADMQFDGNLVRVFTSVIKSSITPGQESPNKIKFGIN